MAYAGWVALSRTQERSMLWVAVAVLAVLVYSAAISAGKALAAPYLVLTDEAVFFIRPLRG